MVLEKMTIKKHEPTNRFNLLKCASFFFTIYWHQQLKKLLKFNLFCKEAKKSKLRRIKLYVLLNCIT